MRVFFSYHMWKEKKSFLSFYYCIPLVPKKQNHQLWIKQKKTSSFKTQKKKALFERSEGCRWFSCLFWSVLLLSFLHLFQSCILFRLALRKTTPYTKLHAPSLRYTHKKLNALRKRRYFSTAATSITILDKKQRSLPISYSMIAFGWLNLYSTHCFKYL